MNIWAVGRNYALHAKELGSEVPREPFFFLKSGNCLVPDSKSIDLPAWGKNIHHELELGIWLDKNLNPSRLCLALDLTERDIQNKAKDAGLPWTLAKSFPGSCPVSSAREISSHFNFDSLEFHLEVNGQLRQKGSPRDMVFKIPQLISYLKQYFPVQPGDLVLTGTPHGVAALHPGDQILATLKGLPTPHELSHEWAVNILKST